MKKRAPEQITMSIGNAIRSLNQAVIFIEEGPSECHVIDSDEDIENLALEHVHNYSGLYDALFRNVHPEDRDSFRANFSKKKLRKHLSEKVFINYSCRIRHKDLKYYWSLITVCNSQKEDSAEGNEYLFLIQDIHEHKTKRMEEYNELIMNMAGLQTKYDELFVENMTDVQTGCFNRKGLMYYQSLVLEKALKNNCYLFVCVLDLNGLKYMNDTFGHLAGDNAIKVVSDGLKAAAPEGSSIIRTGGDEFLVFCALDKDSNAAEGFGAVLDKYLEDYNKSHDNPYEVAASYGCIFMPHKEGMTSLDEYIELADEKMYAMKEKRDEHRRD
jgi:diguanylate cyclase (GGDEF)-like protein